MEPAPPFLRKFRWNKRVEVEISVKATPIFSHDFIGRQDPNDPRYVRVRFGQFSLRTDSRHQIALDKATRSMFIEAAKPLIHRFLLEPPLLDIQPGFMGYLSQPPTPVFSLKTYAVWCSGPDNYAMRRILDGPLMDSKQRFKVRTLKGLRDRLPASALEWFSRYGAHMDPKFDGGLPSEADMISAWAEGAVKTEPREVYVPQLREYVEDIVPGELLPGAVKVKKEDGELDDDESDWSMKMGIGSSPPSSPGSASSSSTLSLSYRPPTPYPALAPVTSDDDSDNGVNALASVEALLAD